MKNRISESIWGDVDHIEHFGFTRRATTSRQNHKYLYKIGDKYIYPDDIAKKNSVANAKNNISRSVNTTILDKKIAKATGNNSVLDKKKQNKKLMAKGKKTNNRSKETIKAIAKGVLKNTISDLTMVPRTRTIGKTLISNPIKYAISSITHPISQVAAPRKVAGKATAYTTNKIIGSIKRSKNKQKHLSTKHKK